MTGTVFAPGPPRGVLSLPGDKSISHRALMLAAMADGQTRIRGLNGGADVAATLEAIRALGAVVTESDDGVVVRGGALRNLRGTIDARNSGTTARLLMGVCAGRGITASFDGDASLRGRPIERVASVLRAMGASVDTTGGRLPATVRGVRNPAGGCFTLDIPSAQIKSAILLAHVDARGDVTIGGDDHSRDHTERMLRRFGRDIDFDGHDVVLRPGVLSPSGVHVPGDLSAAAFFLVAATVTPGGDVLVQDVGVNPTRTGVLDALIAMGAELSLEGARKIDGEPVADIRARHASLRGIDLGGALAVRAIDELPLLAVAAAFAEGVTTIRDAAELRVKESDRIGAIAATLRACGIEVVERPDGLDVRGGRPSPPASALPTFSDHRIAMAIAVLAAASGPVAVDDTSCIDISFPGFVELWRSAQT